jgi:hypothetical protein
MCPESGDGQAAGFGGGFGGGAGGYGGGFGNKSCYVSHLKLVSHRDRRRDRIMGWMNTS